jgi:hypothetical protein
MQPINFPINFGPGYPFPLVPAHPICPSAPKKAEPTRSRIMQDVVDMDGDVIMDANGRVDPNIGQTARRLVF